MKTTAPIWMGIAAIAGLVFIVATGVALVLYDFSISAAVFMGVIFGGIAAIALYFGWRPPLEPLGEKQADATTAPDPVAPPVVAPAIVPEPAPTAIAEPEPAPEPAPEPIAEPTSVATPDPVAVTPATPSASGKPPVLPAPRAGGADNLKLLRGLGPKMEQTLNGHGIYHFDQIAAWTPAEQAWIDENVEGVKGRATRDGWVAQAKTLIAGVAN
ncbi:NADH:ubiquinone oxidoreductase [Yoonia sp.]|uniref:NADH:ubiquinone oxidoreductase n=1 Tax=Yoonia sp. TaxID=2212373 RepID=UPI0039193B4F